MSEDPRRYHYFVDEAGDLTLFDRKGRIIVGDEGVSRCFIVGVALIYEPDRIGADLTELRAQLVHDPYFTGVPSLSPAAGKTARLFHAKDDPTEVRREVFKLLRERNGVEIYAAFRRKIALATDLKSHFERTGEKLGSEHAYDALVTALFENRLHLPEENHIVFARRGKSDRNVALTNAIELAKHKFEQKWRKGINRPTYISSSTPSETIGLQVIDYYLWALQRCLERNEWRFFEYLAPSYRLILDRDDTRRRPYGAYYTASSNPMVPEKLMPVR